MGWLLLLNELSMPVKIGWAICLVWMIAQAVWYYYARVDARMPAPRAAAPRPRRVPVHDRKTVAMPLQRGGSPEFLAALGLAEDPVEVEEPKRARPETYH